MNGTTDIRALREAFRSGLDADRSPECPDSEDLAELAVGTLSGGQRAAVADHLLRCAPCLRDYQLLRRLHLEAEPAPKPARRPVMMALAASVVAAISLSLVLSTGLVIDEPRPPGTYRSTVESVVPADGAVVDEAPSELRWSTGVAAATVRLYDEAALVIFEVEAQDGIIVLPPAIRADLDVGASYFWTVERNDSLDGPYWFRIDQRD